MRNEIRRVLTIISIPANEVKFISTGYDRNDKATAEIQRNRGFHGRIVAQLAVNERVGTLF